MIKIQKDFKHTWHGNHATSYAHLNEEAKYARFFIDDQYWVDQVKFTGKNGDCEYMDSPGWWSFVIPVLDLQGLPALRVWDIRSCWKCEFQGCDMYETVYADQVHGDIGWTRFTFIFHDETLAVQFKLAML